jgi:hypothetical protein
LRMRLDLSVLEVSRSRRLWNLLVRKKLRIGLHERPLPCYGVLNGDRIVQEFVLMQHFVAFSSGCVLFFFLGFNMFHTHKSSVVFVFLYFKLHFYKLIRINEGEILNRAFIVNLIFVSYGHIQIFELFHIFEIFTWPSSCKSYCCAWRAVLTVVQCCTHYW